MPNTVEVRFDRRPIDPLDGLGPGRRVESGFEMLRRLEAISRTTIESPILQARRAMEEAERIRRGDRLAYRMASPEMTFERLQEADRRAQAVTDYMLGKLPWQRYERALSVQQRLAEVRPGYGPGPLADSYIDHQWRADYLERQVERELMLLLIERLRY